MTCKTLHTSKPSKARKKFLQQARCLAWYAWLDESLKACPAGHGFAYPSKRGRAGQEADSTGARGANLLLSYPRLYGRRASDSPPMSVLDSRPKSVVEVRAWTPINGTSHEDARLRVLDHDMETLKGFDHSRICLARPLLLPTSLQKHQPETKEARVQGMLAATMCLDVTLQKMCISCSDSGMIRGHIRMNG